MLFYNEIPSVSPRLVLRVATLRSILQRVLDDLSQVLPSILARDVPDARRQVQHAALRDCALNERGHVRLRVPNSLEAAGHPEPIKEACDGLEEVCADRAVGDRVDRRVRWAHAMEDRESLPVAVGRRGGGELEHGRGGERDTNGDMI